MHFKEILGQFTPQSQQTMGVCRKIIFFNFPIFDWSLYFGKYFVQKNKFLQIGK